MVCRQTLCNFQIPLRGIEGGERLCSQLLDKPLHHTRHFTVVARQIVVVRADFRYVQFLVTGLFQPLCITQSWCKSDGIQKLRLVHLDEFCAFLLKGAPNPTFCVPSQFVSWSAHPLEPPSETYVSALHDMWSTNARKVSMALSVN